MADDELVTAYGSFVLRRHPPARDPSLRAWDAADEYLAAYVAGEDVVGVPAWREPPPGGWLVLDHRAGALAVVLHEHTPVLWSDSSLAHEAARRNLQANGLSPDAVTTLPSTDDPSGPVAVAVVRIPRTLTLLDDLLRRLRPRLAADAVVVAGAMTKDVHTSTIEAFTSVIGPTVTSHARRKARLLHATLDPSLEPGAAPLPTTVVLAPEVTAVVRPGVFAGERLDRGTALLLASTPWAELADARAVVDLGCGSGVLGTAAGTAMADAEVIFVDESYAAVASAEATFSATHRGRACRVVVDDAGATLMADSVDLVLCNPPFHTHGARGDDVALRMFRNARRALAHDGTLVVVGNRHLDYFASLSRLFAEVSVIGQDPRFVVLRAGGRRRP